MPARGLCTDLLEQSVRRIAVAFGCQDSSLRNREHLAIGVCQLRVNRERAIELRAGRLRLSLRQKTARQDLAGSGNPDAHVLGRQLFKTLDRNASGRFGGLRVAFLDIDYRRRRVGKYWPERIPELEIETSKLDPRAARRFELAPIEE
jgi:hypothetical protein